MGQFKTNGALNNVILTNENNLQSSKSYRKWHQMRCDRCQMIAVRLAIKKITNRNILMSLSLCEGEDPGLVRFGENEQPSECSFVHAKTMLVMSLQGSVAVFFFDSRGAITATHGTTLRFPPYALLRLLLNTHLHIPTHTCFLSPPNSLTLVWL